MRMQVLAVSVAGILAGCQAPPEPVEVAPAPLNIRTAPDLQTAQPVYTSRYVKERRAPARELTDILGIPVEAKLPVMSKMSIKDGMEFMLRGSGMSLRTPTSYAESQLYAQPLPLAQTDMGNMSLRESLQVMGGQAFVLEEDVVKREVGFTLKSGYVWNEPKFVSAKPKTASARNLAHSAKGGTQNSAVTMSPRLRKKLSNNAASAQDLESLFMGTPSEQAKTSQPAAAKKVTSKATVKKTQYHVNQGESYRKALTRWAHKDGNAQIAFAQDADFLAALDKQAGMDFVKTGSLAQAIAALSAAIPELQSLTLYPKPSLNLVAFHPWPRQKVTAFVASGKSLQAAVKGATQHYRWNWDDTTSWAAPDYAFTSYPIITLEDDISAAMRVMLSSYPLKAQRLDATKTLYIQEVSPL